jgi:hypothetical protein
MIWNYGNSWEKYPIEGTWKESKTGSIVAVNDLFTGLPGFMLEADMVYCDPPWNTGNLTSFYTKAGLANTKEYENFLKALITHIKSVGPKVCYLEIGRENKDKVFNELSGLYDHVQIWPVTYYRKNPSYLIRGGRSSTATDYTGMDEEYTPLKAMESEDFNCVADFCMGRGLTGIAAYKLGEKFVGTELNKRRLAVLIDRTTKLGAEWSVL